MSLIVIWFNIAGDQVKPGPSPFVPDDQLKINSVVALIKSSHLAAVLVFLFFFF